MIEGHPPADIVAALVKTFGITDRTAWRDLAEIRERWAEAGATARQESLIALNRAILRREHLFKVALGNNDIRTALDTEDSRCRLLGLFPTAKLDANVTAKAAVQVSGDVKLTHKADDEVLQRLHDFGRVFDALAAAGQAEVSGDPVRNGHHKPVDS